MDSAGRSNDKGSARHRHGYSRMPLVPNGFRIPLPCDTAENFDGLNRRTAGCHDARVQLCCFFRLPSAATKSTLRSADLRLTVPLLTVLHLALARSRLGASRQATASPHLASHRIAVLCPAETVPLISAIRRFVSRPVPPAAASCRRGGKRFVKLPKREKKVSPSKPAQTLSCQQPPLPHSTAPQRGFGAPLHAFFLSALQSCRQTVHSGRCGAPSPLCHPRAIYRSMPLSRLHAAIPSPSSRFPPPPPPYLI